MSDPFAARSRTAELRAAELRAAPAAAALGRARDRGGDGTGRTGAEGPGVEVVARGRSRRRHSPGHDPRDRPRGRRQGLADQHASHGRRRPGHSEPARTGRVQQRTGARHTTASAAGSPRSTARPSPSAALTRRTNAP